MATWGRRFRLLCVTSHYLMSVTRRDFLAGTAATLSMPAAVAKRPNLVYVFADQLRYQSCGYAGDEFAHTPNIDRLAAQGCNFQQAISNTPVCAPYRASPASDR